MTADRIRFGLLSFAHPHAQAWGNAAATSEDAEFIGIWDDNLARGQTMAAGLGTTLFADLHSLLARCDAVGITAETAQHPALVERAAAAKVHVLCEKPPAVDIAAFERIEAAVRQSGILYAQSFPKRLDPASLELRRLVSDGRLGRVGLIRLRHGHGHGLDPAFRGTWFTDPAQAGGGALLDEGVHALDFVAWLLGRPAWIRAAISNSQLQLAVEDTATVILGYGDGRLAEISTSWVFMASDNSIEVHGDRGSAVLGGVDLASRDLVSSGHLRICTEQQVAGHRREWEVIDVPPAFQGDAFHELAVRQFVADLRLNRPPEIGLADARQSLELVGAAYEAARTGRTVTL